MYVVERSFDYEYPVARVSDVFTDLENWGEWSEVRGLFKKSRMSFAPAEGSLRGPGLKIVASNKKGHAHTLVAQEWEKPRKIRFLTFEKGPDAAFKLDMTWLFTAKGALATHFDYHLEFDVDVPALFAPFVQRSAEKKIDEIFKRGRTFL